MSQPLLSQFNSDALGTILLLGGGLLLVVSYTIRALFKGKAHYERVNQQGSSAWLSRDLMEMAYWGMQPWARLFISLHISPNALSWASLVLGLSSGVCLAFGHFGFGAFFAAISAFLDTLDGMVARLTHVASDAGEVLDATIDRYAEFFFLGGLVIYYGSIPMLVLLTLAALCGSFMVSYSTAKAEALQVKLPKGGFRRPERAVILIAGAALSPMTIPWLEVYRSGSIAVGHPMVIALFTVAVLSNLSAVERLSLVAQEMRIREEKARARNKLSADGMGEPSEQKNTFPII